MLIINRIQIHVITGNYRIIPSVVGENLPEVTGLDYGKNLNALIFRCLKNSRNTRFYQIK
jgi:hypothetical protein